MDVSPGSPRHRRPWPRLDGRRDTVHPPKRPPNGRAQIAARAGTSDGSPPRRQRQGL